jgi:2-oxoisovalerate dehydrogenase E1 component
MLPFGKARTVRAGTDLTIVTYGATVQRALAAANQMHEERGIDAEVIDLRSLSPWDHERVYESVKRTNRVIVAYEDAISWGYGAEIAARIADDCFAWLDAPVKRVASTDTFVGYAPRLEDAILPQVDDFKRAIDELASF